MTLLMLTTLRFDQYSGLYAQDLTPDPMYSLDPYRAIPAYAGLAGRSVISTAYRSQWEVLPGSPVVYNIYYNSPLRMTSGSFGIGAELSRSGVHQLQRLMTGYHHVLQTGEYLLSAGGGLGIINAIYQSDLIRTPEGEYGSGNVDHRDPILGSGRFNNSQLCAGLSAYLQTRWLEGGFDYRFAFAKIGGGDPAFYRPGQYFKLMLMRNIALEQWNVRAYFLDYTDLKVNQEEILVQARYRNQFEIGLLWRGLRNESLDAAGGQFSFHLGRGVWLGYLAEWPLNVLKKQIGGITQQFGLKFEFNAVGGSNKLPIIYNPRW
ncbi:MAG TPA: type IX secretion system membrane protein PorP/SprF, partial [Saprospiraceae bacterium]|nr:type IX secretion system membrane protein PorP/SprF [Saprospiraceae bacterium]